MLDPEVSDLGAPAQEERAQGEHGRHVPDADVAHLNAPGRREVYQKPRISSVHLSLHRFKN